MKIPIEVEVFLRDHIKNGTDFLTLYYLTKDKYLNQFKKFPTFNAFQKIVVKLKEQMKAESILMNNEKVKEEKNSSKSISSIEEILKLKTRILNSDTSALNKKEALELLIGICAERINSLEKSSNGTMDVRVEQLINKYLTEIRQIIVEMTRLQDALQKEIDDKFSEVLTNVLIEFLMFVFTSIREIFGEDPRLPQLFNSIMEKCENSTNLIKLKEKKEDIKIKTHLIDMLEEEKNEIKK
ncbi:MAG: hypothetical protein QXY70_00500 [Nanopusillaceae archaeon]